MCSNCVHAFEETQGCFYLSVNSVKMDIMKSEFVHGLDCSIDQNDQWPQSQKRGVISVSTTFLNFFIYTMNAVKDSCNIIHVSVKVLATKLLIGPISGAHFRGVCAYMVSIHT